MRTYCEAASSLGVGLKQQLPKEEMYIVQCSLQQSKDI